ncbi:MAG TPA: CBASS cGAMP-activated phospholipase [Bradyrhizobium sp.]|uniref:CBASS cGAMP-activated phospholipase n=1 Tax=Bradyrhizobium sp. TaxID=376 RepID=UPI002CBF5874|nr:CBASS cGAMP-activated phospholipase [Bradyrhizobium sp.]HXB80816.1 CBASS cGAMP-activated phospholipase [Bradyrhizobium sp.]
MRRSSGTLQGLREQLPWPEGKPFRILSIDGGGIRGILPAAILAELEGRYLGSKSAGDYFDLITGTSTGGIIALGLSVGKTAQSILDLYINHGKEIFPPIHWDLWNIRRRWRCFRALQHHRYKADKLEALLKSAFSEKTLGEAQRRLCVPSFDGFTEVNVFKTPHHADYKMDWKERMLTVAMATAAAPAYFPIYKDGGRFFADGGVWANNPIMIGLVDALVCYGLERRQVHILSLGCGDTEIRFTENQIVHGGLVDWYEIISSAMHLQSQNAMGQAGLLIGHDQLLRLNAPSMPDNPIALDDYDRAKSELPTIAAELVSTNGQAIQDRFLYEEAEPYKAFYGPRASIEVTSSKG